MKISNTIEKKDSNTSISIEPMPNGCSVCDHTGWLHFKDSKKRNYGLPCICDAGEWIAKNHFEGIRSGDHIEYNDKRREEIYNIIKSEPRVSIESCPESWLKPLLRDLCAKVGVV